MADIQSATAEIRRGKQEEEEETTGQKYYVCICYAGRPYTCIFKRKQYRSPTHADSVFTGLCLLVGIGSPQIY